MHLRTRPTLLSNKTTLSRAVGLFAAFVVVATAACSSHSSATDEPRQASASGGENGEGGAGGEGGSTTQPLYDRLTLESTLVPRRTLVNAPLTITFTATGGVGAHTFSITSGKLPSGVTLSTSGELSGTPTALGAFEFEVTVTDLFGHQVTKKISLVVERKRWVAFRYEREPSVNSLAVTDVSTSQLARYALSASDPTLTNVEGFAWAPDGQSLAFWAKSSDAKRAALYVVDLSAKEPAPPKLLAERASFGEVVWSPSGGKLAFSTSFGASSIVELDLMRGGVGPQPVGTGSSLHWLTDNDIAFDTGTNWYVAPFGANGLLGTPYSLLVGSGLSYTFKSGPYVVLTTDGIDPEACLGKTMLVDFETGEKQTLGTGSKPFDVAPNVRLGALLSSGSKEVFEVTPHGTEASLWSSNDSGCRPGIWSADSRWYLVPSTGKSPTLAQFAGAKFVSEDTLLEDDTVLTSRSMKFSPSSNWLALRSADDLQMYLVDLSDERPAAAVQLGDAASAVGYFSPNSHTFVYDASGPSGVQLLSLVDLSDLSTSLVDQTVSPESFVEQPRSFTTDSSALIYEATGLYFVDLLAESPKARELCAESVSDFAVQP